MDFLQKIFPRIQKKLSSKDTSKNNCVTKSDFEISINPYPSQVVTNVLECNAAISNNKNNTSDPKFPHDDNNEIETNKTLCLLENVVPLEFRLNNTNQEEPTVTDELDEKSEHKHSENNGVIIFDNVLENMVKQNLRHKNNKLIETEVVNNARCDNAANTFTNEDATLLNFSNINNETKVLNDRATNVTGISNDIMFKTDVNTFNTVLDDKTLEGLKEFENTLNSFNEIACLADDYVEELINLDEFNELFDGMDTEQENSNCENRYTCKNSSETSNANSKLSEIKDTNENVPNPEYNIDDIEVISLSSASEDEKSQNCRYDTISINSDTEEPQDSDCEGYNSSDFEFISETEAHRDGFIINFSRNNYQNDDTHFNSSSDSEPLSTFVRQNREENVVHDINGGAPEAGEGPSGLNIPKNQYEDRSYRKNHFIPEGDDYLGLFQGIHNPLMPVCEIYFMENKSVRASAMNIQYEGIGFDKQLVLRGHQPDSSEEEFEDEANECVKKILNMYPGENRKRRRRY